MSDETDIPRWAKELGATTWDRINELIDAGWEPTDIKRELSIPQRKLRSLQEYVEKYGPRRRLMQFARFKDAMLAQIEKFGADMVKSISVIAAKTVSDKTPTGQQIRGLEVMNNFIGIVSRMMAQDAKEARNADVRIEISDKRKKLPADAIRELKTVYGLVPPAAAGDEEHDDS